MEKILNIEEVDVRGEAGYQIKTNKQVISLLIDSYQSCCEDWGYFMSEEDTDSYIGANLTDIQITDTALNKESFNDFYNEQVMFVDLITDRGVLQFVAYNDHNGYYGHQARVISEQLNHSEWL
jgi:hypothetical protein